MIVRFWGTRGSIPTPGAGTARYEGNTSCVEVRSDDGNLFIFDCGTGIRQLGLSLLGASPKPPRIHLLIGHTRWDHIQGFPFLRRFFSPVPRSTSMPLSASSGAWKTPCRARCSIPTSRSS